MAGLRVNEKGLQRCIGAFGGNENVHYLKCGFQSHTLHMGSLNTDDFKLYALNKYSLFHVNYTSKKFF